MHLLNSSTALPVTADQEITIWHPALAGDLFLSLSIGLTCGIVLVCFVERKRAWCSFSTHNCVGIGFMAAEWVNSPVSTTLPKDLF